MNEWLNEWTNQSVKWQEKQGLYENFHFNQSLIVCFQRLESFEAKGDLIKNPFFANLLSFSELLIESHGKLRSEIFINLTDILFHVKGMSI